MRLHRFFVNEFIEGTLEALSEGEVRIADKDLIHQWKDVFRLRAGDDVILLDNTGNEYLSNISELHKEGARLHISEITESKNMPKRNITLYCSLIKKDNFEWILEKGTELGVGDFAPLLSERSEKKDLNMERAAKIIKEASEQSGRGILPRLHEVGTLESVLKTAAGKVIALHTSGKKFVRNEFENGDLGILVGPEGGWSDKELGLFRENKIEIFSMGPHVLRAETAAIAISALLIL